MYKYGKITGIRVSKKHLVNILRLVIVKIIEKSITLIIYINFFKLKNNDFFYYFLLIFSFNIFPLDQKITDLFRYILKFLKSKIFNIICKSG